MQEAREGYQYACSLIGKKDSEAVLDSIFNEANLSAIKKKKSNPKKK